MTSTRFTSLVDCALPIQMAPIGAAGQDPRLAIAVARAGGHAMYPGVQLDAHQLGAAVDDVRAATGAFGVNFVVPLMTRACLELASRRAPVVDLFYGDPTAEIVEAVHRGGALASWQVGSAEEARAAVDCGCDIVVAQGTQAGGRIRGAHELRELLDLVLAAVDVPVVAAGGIATAEHVAAALGAGADAVRVGTRFLAAAEADVHPAYQQAVLEAERDDAVITRAFAAGVPDFPHRVLQRSLDAAHAVAAPPYTPELPTRDFEGDVRGTPFYAGQSVGDVRAVQPAAEIVAELAEGVRAATQAARASAGGARKLRTRTERVA